MMLNWQLRKHLHHLRDSGRLAVLICLMLHKNGRNRSWPSNKTIMKETGYASASVTAALQWLAEVFAIMPVPYDKRMGDEKKLHQRRIIWQLTGVAKLDGQFHKYLHMTPEEWGGILSELQELGNNSVSEYLATEYSVSEYSLSGIQEGDSLPEGVDLKRKGVAPARRKRSVPDKTATAQLELDLIDAWCMAMGYDGAEIGATFDTSANRRSARQMLKWKIPATPEEVRRAVALKRSKRTEYAFAFLVQDIPAMRARDNLATPKPADNGQKADIRQWNAAAFSEDGG